MNGALTMTTERPMTTNRSSFIVPSVKVGLQYSPYTNKTSISVQCGSRDIRAYQVGEHRVLFAHGTLNVMKSATLGTLKHNRLHMFMDFIAVKNQFVYKHRALFIYINFWDFHICIETQSWSTLTICIDFIVYQFTNISTRQVTKALQSRTLLGNMHALSIHIQ